MITVKSAVQIAFDLFKELYDTKKFEDILLEEVELSEDKNSWLVTLGFYRQMPSVNIMESLGSKKYIRTYKTIEIDAASGEMIAMKNSGRAGGLQNSVQE
jgi:hypothetical protein